MNMNRGAGILSFDVDKRRGKAPYRLAVISMPRLDMTTCGKD